MREKLINELANDIAFHCPDMVCNGCGVYNCASCIAERLADDGYHKAVQKWIPATERLPEKDVLVLCIGAKGGMFLGYPRLMSHDDTAYTRVPNARGGRYTKYWCYLPEPPKGE